jgi:molybdopterin synthase catalytic subunit
LSTRLVGEPFDPWRELADHQTGLAAGKFGACCNFTGTMRDFNAGDSVTSMRLDHYPDMTQRFLDTICDEARARWNILDCLIVHRYGEIRPDETIVLTAAWAAHRADAFDACRYLIEELKARAPFWKKERTADGERWVHDTSTPE